METTALLTDASVIDFGLFVAGCVAGYTWAHRTIVKISNERIEELKTELHDAKGRIQALEDLRFDLARGEA